MRRLFYVLFIAVLALTSCKNDTEQKHGTEQKISLVKPTVFYEKMAEHEGKIIDVRTEKEYNAGHIKNAINMHLYDKDFEKQLETLDKDQRVYVYCKAGGRSAEAVNIMKEKGFKRVIELDGGIDAWLEAKKPVVK
ncbi:hypothetical protein GCM10007424_20460 [Flavobacterium suaedae]|uniref:Rhodanese domain-containing protein n=1 Tax=Flavobacterium suaedae TaxID=1767027 RepID=A0ABQ1K0A7_9FLAO|nr:rhodanese-like domain-containing protein [Flavobacterium suaedae]GGB80251.1 hypothetical protein GCM10007424_20460 [Flavobacterium suaedae]